MKLTTAIIGLGIITSLVFNPILLSSTNYNTSVIEAVEDEVIDVLYASIYFEGEMPEIEIFKKAIKGFVYLKATKQINQDQNIITVIDFSKPSTAKRLWVIDLFNKNVLFNTVVAHGRNTGLDMAEKFSNKPESYMSSLGFYVTGKTYDGKHGYSLQLHGKEYGFNNNAFKRAVVMHSADYVDPKFVQANGRLGRSLGCPTIPSKLQKPIIDAVKDGTCLFIYYPDQVYLQKSKILNS